MSVPSDDIAIQAAGVTFAYPDGTRALDGVDFAAHGGEFLAVVGANGSGKTTLMRVLMRLLRPQAGRVTLGERDIATLPAGELYARIGMVFQNPSDQLFAATVEQDVAFGPRNLGLPEREVAECVEAALADVGAAALRDRPIHHLSFGEQKRVCLAGVLAMKPAILVLDEPTAGLDPIGEMQMIELLRRLNREQNVTMIVATHELDLLASAANRLCVLARGQVVRQGPPGEILTDTESATAMGLRLPLIAQLFHELTRDGLAAQPLPLSIEQARAAIAGWMAKGPS
ncbi:MAG: ATP-binding cassette domain-containing protein [Phycisphaerae bacterium]|nr:ATP-binding cassette domain-containing protein [Phycisphaerae bacterium]